MFDQGDRQHPAAVVMEATTGFVGWLRFGGGHWQAAVQAEDRDLCAKMLLGIESPHGTKHVELIVLPSGAHPEDRPSAGRRNQGRGTRR